MSDKEPVTLEIVVSRYAGLVSEGLAEEADFGDSTPAQILEHYNTVLEDLYTRIKTEVNGKPKKERVYNAAIDAYNDLQDSGGKLAPSGSNGSAQPEETSETESAEETSEAEASSEAEAAPAEETPKAEAAPAEETSETEAESAKSKTKRKPVKEPPPPPEPKVLVFQGFERFGLNNMADVEKYTNPKFGTDGLYVIPPAMAAEWLEKFNVRNRQLYKSNWKRLGDAATGVAGRAWTYNGDRIGFFSPWDDPKDEHGFPVVIKARDANGNVKGKLKMDKNQLVLANAQHRLTFAVEYGVPLITEVVFNLPWLSDNYIDSHQKTRTMKDALVKDGHNNANLLSQTAAFLIRYQSKKKGAHLLPTSPWPSVSQGQEFIHKNTTLPTFVAAVTDSVFAMKHQPKFWVAALFLLRKQKDAVEEVVSKITDFAELKKGDPLLVLQKALTQMEGKKRGGVAAMDSYGALILAAIQAKVTNTSLLKLAFGMNEMYPEL